VKIEVSRESGFGVVIWSADSAIVALGGTGLLLRILFELKRHIFSNILDGPANEHLSWDFYSDEARGVDPSILGILFIHVEAERTIRKTQGIEGSRIIHDRSVSLSAWSCTGNIGFVRLSKPLSAGYASSSIESHAAYYIANKTRGLRSE
jgi:hypothetical protein